MLNYAGGTPNTGYNLQRSLRFRASASAYLNRTNTGTVTNNAVWTYSAWVKLGYWSSGNAATLLGTGAGGSANESSIKYVNNQINVINYVGSSVKCRYITTAVYRDPSAWYHVVVSSNSSTSLRIYINNVQITAFDTAVAPDSSAWGINTASTASYMGWLSGNAYFDGYMAEVNFIDGQALTPSSFGSTNTLTGVWQPAKYTGTYGTNGFYLPFTDNSALTTSSNVGLGKDFSGNGNYWATNNISITAGVTYDSMTDMPTLTSATAANFAVLNPLSKGSGVTIQDANLTYVLGATSDYTAFSSIGMSSGKWYCEATIGAPAKGVVGICKESVNVNNYLGFDANGWSYYSLTGQKANNGSLSTYGATYTANDVIGIAFDADAGTLTYYKNNISQGVAFTGLTNGPYFFAQGSSSCTIYFNFGQRPFTYTPPTGFVALNTYNLPTSTILKGNTVMDATLYTGNSSTQSIVNAAAFKPDLVWLKARSQAYSNALYDSVRGATKTLLSNTTDAEATEALTLTAFNSNGFSLSTAPRTNESPTTYVAWQWQAGQGSTSSNTSGSITSTVSVNASAGFSVVTYTGTGTNGATVGHGLGVTPAFVIVKARSAVQDWLVHHQSFTTTANDYLILNTTANVGTAANWFSKTSSTIGFPTAYSTTNVNAQTQVAYCWAEIAGFSKFGFFTGIGTSDNTFVYTGFLPKFLLIKLLGVDNWQLWDTSRGAYNVNTPDLYPNSSAAESSVPAFDFVSNGFKTRSTASGTYIYAAFAENPFKNSLAR